MKKQMAEIYWQMIRGPSPNKQIIVWKGWVKEDPSVIELNHHDVISFLERHLYERSDL